MTDASRDENRVPTALGVSSVDGTTPVPFRVDPVTGRLLTDITGGGSGTVTSVSVVSVNGFAGTVANATTTPAISISTTVNAPVLAGNGTAIAAATTTGSGSLVVLATGPTLTTPVIGAATGTSLTVTGLLQSTSLLLEDPGVGAFTVTLQAPSGLGASYALTFPADDGASGEVLSTNGSGVLSWVSAGGVPTTITVANEAADTTCFVGFFTAATGDLGPKTNGNLTFNASTGVLTAVQTIVGSITGNAATVTVADAAADATTFVLLATDATGSLSPRTDAGLTYDASANNLTTTTFTGALSGNATTATTATTATNWTMADEATDTTCFLAFVTAATGNLPGKTNTNLTYNSNTGALSIGTSAAFTAGTIELGAAADTTLARSAAGQISVEGVQVVTISNTVTLTNKIVSQTVEPATDDTYTGENITGLNAGATIAQWDCVYLGSASKWLLTDADAASSAGGVMVGMATTSGTDTNPLTVILRGVVRNDGWTWATVGAPLYLDTATAGGMTLTAPSGTDDVVRIVGYVLSDDCIYFNPSNDWITRV